MTRRWLFRLLAGALAIRDRVDARDHGRRPSAYFDVKGRGLVEVFADGELVAARYFCHLERGPLWIPLPSRYRRVSFRVSHPASFKLWSAMVPHGTVPLPL